MVLANEPARALPSALETNEGQRGRHPTRRQIVDRKQLPHQNQLFDGSLEMPVGRPKSLRSSLFVGAGLDLRPHILGFGELRRQPARENTLYERPLKERKHVSAVA